MANCQHALQRRVRHLRLAQRLREARREKIHLFCVTVDQEGADYLPQMYSDANFVVIDDVRTLPQKLPQLYRRLTT